LTSSANLDFAQSLLAQSLLQFFQMQFAISPPDFGDHAASLAQPETALRPVRAVARSDHDHGDDADHDQFQKRSRTWGAIGTQTFGDPCKESGRGGIAGTFLRRSCSAFGVLLAVSLPPSFMNRGNPNGGTQSDRDCAAGAAEQTRNDDQNEIQIRMHAVASK